MNPQGAFAQDYLAYLLARASHLVSGEFHQVVEANGLTPLEWRVLASLSGNQPLRISALADMVLAKQPTVTKLIDRLAAAGWVHRGQDAHDRRQCLVHLSAAGQHKVAPLLEVAREHEQRVLQQLGAPSARALKQALEALIRQLAPETPRCEAGVPASAAQRLRRRAAAP
jgi:DNA-binding MarR family transcriptional regulator